MSADLILSTLLGMARGALVQFLIYPLDVVKTHQQCSNSCQKASLIAKNLFQTEGIGAFYRGISFKLGETSLKQIWVWPFITTAPSYLSYYPNYVQLAITGLLTATVDATIGSPLIRGRVHAIMKKEKTSLLKGGWNGFFTNFAATSAQWTTFLTAQHYFREPYHKKAQSSKIPFKELILVGLKVAFVVSVASFPFDLINIRKQANLSYLLPEATFRRYFRGFPLYLYKLSIHNIASVSLMEQLEQFKKNSEVKKLL